MIQFILWKVIQMNRVPIVKVILNEAGKLAVNLDHIELLNVGEVTVKVFSLIVLVPTPILFYIGTD